LGRWSQEAGDGPRDHRRQHGRADAGQMGALIPIFERASGNKVAIKFEGGLRSTANSGMAQHRPRYRG
jgi:hypothetical protein